VPEFERVGTSTRHRHRGDAAWIEDSGYPGVQGALAASEVSVVPVRPSPAGLHLVGMLPEGQDDRLASRAAAEHGVRAAALSQYAISTPAPPGLLLGYTGFADDELVSAVERLATALRGLH
jgi:GntR family transcriptional regulator/MocR family aminotransferase